MKYKYIAAAILLLIIVWLLAVKCNRSNNTITTDNPSPSATPANKWLRKELNVIIDTTVKYKQLSVKNKAKTAPYYKVLRNTLSQVYNDTSKVDTLYKISIGLANQVQIDSIIIKSQDDQIGTFKAIDSTNAVINDSLVTDSNKEIKRAKKHYRNQGIKIGVVITVIIVALVAFALK